MSMPRPESLLIGFSLLIVAAVWPVCAAAQVGNGENKPLTVIISKGELHGMIETWTKIQSETLQASFHSDVTVRVDNDAADFLVGQYTERSVSGKFLEDHDLSRFVVTMDLYTVLKRSFEQTVQSEYQTLFRFLQSKSSEIAIRLQDIHVALNDEDCSIIPCPPDKCRPDCGPKAFERFEKAPGLYPCVRCTH